MRGFSFDLDGEYFAVDVSLVQKVARKLTVTPVPAAPDEVAGIANIQGRVLAVLSIPALLARHQEAAVARKPQVANVAVLKPFSGDGDQMGLLIGKAAGLTEIDESKITPPPVTEGEESVPYIAGVAESGAVLYRILDIKAIISRFADEGFRHAAETPGRFLE